MEGMTKIWEIPPPADPGELLVNRVLGARGIINQDERNAFLTTKFSDLDNPSELPGAQQAAELLCKSLKEGKKVLIYGDYDADGITASVVLYHIIAAATGKVGPPIYIPDRIKEGYGINVKAIEQFAQDGIDLVISVDCGVTAIDAAERAKDLGILLIVTDHHKPREDGKLPDCVTIVHPDLKKNPNTRFAGVGVAFQLAWAFGCEWSGSKKVNDELRDCLIGMVPFAAIGTIADMVPLQKGNRILARAGLQWLPNSTNPGLRAVMAELKTPINNLNTSHVSFGIAPLINAIGRLSHASKAVDLFTHLDGVLASSMAKELAKANRERRKIQLDIVADATRQIEEKGLVKQKIIVLQSDKWNRGVVGIAAGKCIEKHYCPTILLSGDGDELVGSARSVSGFSIFDALHACEEYLVKFGGHDMAAGLTIERDKFDDFVNTITAYADKHIKPEQLIKTVRPDVIAEFDEIDYSVAMELEKIGPFGIGNPTPVVQIMGVRVDDVSALGNKGAHLLLQLGTSKKRTKCIWWNNGDASTKIQRGSHIDIIAKVKRNEFRGHKSAELDIVDIKLPSG